MTDDAVDGGYSRLAILVSALVGFAVATLAITLLHREAVFFEQLYRVEPTVRGGGVGSDWVTGNTIPWLDALVALTHAADVLMGLFILVMVFIHWGAFRRLAARMRSPGSEETGGVAADGGRANGGGGSSASRAGDRARDRGDRR